MERQSSAASSTEETSGPQGDLSSGSRRDDGQPDFTVFKDFDFLEYEDSIAGESTDNFNWGVRRHQLFEGEEDLFACNSSVSGACANGNGMNTNGVISNAGGNETGIGINGGISSNSNGTGAIIVGGNGAGGVCSGHNNNNNHNNNNSSSSSTGIMGMNSNGNGGGIIGANSNSLSGGLFGSSMISFKGVHNGSHSSALEDSYSDKTPILSKRRRQTTEDSSDEEGESESPIDEDHRQSFTKNGYNGQLQGPPSSLCLREHRRRNSVSRSDTSGSSAGDLGDITPCNASPHLPSGIIRFCSSAVVRDEAEENWRKQLQSMLIHQPFAPTDELLLHLYCLVKEVTFKAITITKEAKKFFTGIGSHLGNRISLFTDLLNSRADPPRVWCSETPLTIVTTPRFFETLRFNVLEVQEHLETFFDRKDQVMEVCTDLQKEIKSIKTKDKRNTPFLNSYIK